MEALKIQDKMLQLSMRIGKQWLHHTVAVACKPDRVLQYSLCQKGIYHDSQWPPPSARVAGLFLSLHPGCSTVRRNISSWPTLSDPSDPLGRIWSQAPARVPSLTRPNVNMPLLPITMIRKSISRRVFKPSAVQGRDGIAHDQFPTKKAMGLHLRVLQGVGRGILPV